METTTKMRFPLREAYAFAASNGLGREADEIRDMEIEWDRSYTSTVRRGRLLRLFETHGLLPRFLTEVWPWGSSDRGESERRFCHRVADEYDAFLKHDSSLSDGSSEPEESEGLQFALEAHLRDFLAKNPAQVEPGLHLYQQGDRTGVEFPVDGGRIDLLAIDRNGKFVVIELKLAQGRNKALGQLLYYMGWVDRNLGNGPCRGMIVASEIADELTVAVSRTEGISLARYKMNFSVESVESDRVA